VIFKGLEIKQSYEKISDEYQYVWVGVVHVESANAHRISLKITPELCERLIDCCADHIIDVATEAAENMKATVIEHFINKKITDKESEEI
jgi:hypothetical protein